MTRSRPAQLSFSSGEISPLLYSRPDYQRNQTGLRTCNGFLPLRQGGITRAPGTIFRGYTKDNAPAKLINFEFAENDALTLEFTDQSMRAWRYGELVDDSGSPYELDTPYDASVLAYLQWVQSADVIYIADGEQPIQKLSRFALDNWTIEPFELNSGPFKIQNLDETKTIQCSSVYGSLSIWQPNESLVVGDERRHGLRVYRFSGIDVNRDDGVVLELSPTHESGEVGYSTLIEPGNSNTNPVYRVVYWEYLYTAQYTGTIDLTSNGSLFTSDHVGTLFRIEPTDFKNIPLWVADATTSAGSLMSYDKRIYEVVVGTNTGLNPPLHDHGERRTDAGISTIFKYVSDFVGIVKITAVADANNATADVMRPIPQPAIDDPTYRWSEGAWSETYGYPKAVEIFDQSLFAGFTPSEPRGIWASALGDFADFSPSVEADGAFAYTISGSDTQNSGTWLRRARRGIYIGALGEVIRGFSNANGQRIGPTTFDTSVEATDGSRNVRPITPYGYPVFVTKDGNRIEEIRFSFEEDGGKPVELSLPSQHIGADGFAEIVWQSAPQRLAWQRTGAGELTVMLYDPDEQVLGWARCSVAGGFVEALSMSSSADGKSDILNMVVRRTINGQTVRMFEEQAVVFGIIAGNEPICEAVHLFAALQFTSEVATDTFDVPHLIGENVHAWTDAGEYGPYLVPASGSITIDVAVNKATIGLLDETHEAEILDIPAAAKDGSSTGRKKRLQSGSGIILHRTAAGAVQTVERNFARQEVVSRPVELVPRQIAADIVDGFTGTSKLENKSGYAEEVSLRFKPSGGAPLSIMAIMPNIEEAGA